MDFMSAVLTNLQVFNHLNKQINAHLIYLNKQQINTELHLYADRCCQDGEVQVIWTFYDRKLTMCRHCHGLCFSCHCTCTLLLFLGTEQPIAVLLCFMFFKISAQKLFHCIPQSVLHPNLQLHPPYSVTRFGFSELVDRGRAGLMLVSFTLCYILSTTFCRAYSPYSLLLI